ncbi:MAG: hypothetical protein ABS36_16475 [Acidobacteria bacterium SCN 69-37]|nr:MAG: hypothetical protein ABS36_16475 [Acidobacteria bacterium SCN 69-37]
MAARLRREALQAEMNEALATQGTLRVLPDLTGGRTVVNRNAPEQTVSAIFRESESYYLIGFEAARDPHAGAFRSIDVKVARRDVQVSTRRRYLPPAASEATSSAPASVRRGVAPDDAVNGLLPDATRPLTMAVAAFASPDGGDAIVSASVDVSGFVYDTASSIPLDVSVSAVDQAGRSVASARQTSTIPGPRPASNTGVPIHLPTHLVLPPGDYEVRVAVTDTTTDTMASVFSQIVVPAFASERLALSDIAIERPASAAASVPAAPTTERSFARTDQVQALLQISQGTERTDSLQPASLRVRIIDTHDVAERDQSIVLAPDQFGTNRTATSRLTLPVQNLAPGEYLLRVEAAIGERTAARLVRFAVR